MVHQVLPEKLLRRAVNETTFIKGQGYPLFSDDCRRGFFMREVATHSVYRPLGVVFSVPVTEAI